MRWMGGQWVFNPKPPAPLFARPPTRQSKEAKIIDPPRPPKPTHLVPRPKLRLQAHWLSQPRVCTNELRPAGIAIRGVTQVINRACGYNLSCALAQGVHKRVAACGSGRGQAKTHAKR